MLNIQLQPGDLQGDIVPQAGSPLSPAVQPVPGISLQLGNSWYSPSGAYRLTLQASDGNLVWQTVDDSTLPPWQQGQPLDPSNLNWVPLWSPFIQNRNVSSVWMQFDGNLAAYVGFPPDGPGQPGIGITNTSGNQSSFLRLQDDGNLVVYTSNGQAIFATNTSVLETPGRNA